MSWTRHGHYSPGTTMHDQNRPPICRCGGVGLCKACNMDAALHWGRENHNNPPTERDPEKMDYLVSFTKEVRETLNTLANHRLAQDNILEKLLNDLREIKNSDNIRKKE